MSDTTTPQFRFDTDTAVTPPPGGPGPGAWTGHITPNFDIGDKPNGGYLLSTAIRAMAGAMPESTPHPFSVTAHYLRPGEPGPVTCDVDLVRTGRTLSTATGSLIQNGKEKLRLVGTFGNLHTASGPTVVDAALPSLPSVEECTPRASSDAAHYIASRISTSVDVRLNPAVGFARGVPSGTAEVTGWFRFTDNREPDVLSLALFADAMPPAVFEVLKGRGWVPTVELTVHFRGIPAPGWLRARFRTRYLMDGFFEEDGEIWDSTDRLVAQSRQLAMVLQPPTA